MRKERKQGVDNQWGTQGPEQALREIYATECDEFVEILYLGAVAAQEGKPPPEGITDFLRHHAYCRRCQETYRDVKMLLETEAQIGLLPTGVAPVQSMQPSAENRALDGLRESIGQGIEWVADSAQAGAHLIIDLALLWARPGRVALRSTADEATLGEWTLPVSQSKLGFGVEVRLRLLDDVEDHSLSTLTAEISLPNRWPDFSGVIVALYLPNGEVQRQRTGTTGIVRFPHLLRQAIATMRLAVELPTYQGPGDAIPISA